MNVNRDRPVRFAIMVAAASVLLALAAFLPAIAFQQAARNSLENLPGMRGAIVAFDASPTLDRLVAADSARNVLMFRKMGGVWRETGAYRSPLAVRSVALSGAEGDTAILVATTYNAKVVDIETGALRFDSGLLYGDEGMGSISHQDLDVILYARGRDLVLAEVLPDGNYRSRIVSPNEFFLAEGETISDMTCVGRGLCIVGSSAGLVRILSVADGRFLASGPGRAQSGIAKLSVRGDGIEKKISILARHWNGLVSAWTLDPSANRLVTEEVAGEGGVREAAIQSVFQITEPYLTSDGATVLGRSGGGIRQWRVSDGRFLGIIDEALFTYLQDAASLAEALASSPDDASIEFRTSVPPTALSALTETEGVSEQEELDCLAQAVYYEARSEGTQGQLAVAEVVMNRVRNPNFPKSICDVVYQGRYRETGCQFTFTCDGSLKNKPGGEAWDRAKAIALNVALGLNKPVTNQATHYHTDYVNPYWKAGLVETGEIGTHIFYRFPKTSEEWRKARVALDAQQRADGSTLVDVEEAPAPLVTASAAPAPAATSTRIDTSSSPARVVAPDESVRRLVQVSDRRVEIVRNSPRCGEGDALAFAGPNPTGAHRTEVSEDGWVCFFPDSGGSHARRIDDTVHAVAMGEREVAIASSRDIRVFDRATGETRAIITAHAGTVTTLKFSHDQTRVLSGDTFGNVVITDLALNRATSLDPGLVDNPVGIADLMIDEILARYSNPGASVNYLASFGGDK